MWSNFAHLFSVSLIPFTTEWIADSRLSAAPMASYASVFVLVNVTYLALCSEAVDRFPSRSTLGTDQPPSVRLFDVNETLIDIDSMAPLFGELFGDQRVLREWFNQLVMYSMTVTLSAQYVDFFTLGHGVLQMLAGIHRVRLTDDDVGRVKTAMRTMPAYPDVADGLATLRANSFRVATLTDSPHIGGGPTPLENAGLAGFFRTTVDRRFRRAFKPAPAVYRYACRVLEAEPADCMMVAAHVWDLLGAHNVGFSSALITRPGNPPCPSTACHNQRSWRATWASSPSGSPTRRADDRPSRHKSPFFGGVSRAFAPARHRTRGAGRR